MKMIEAVVPKENLAKADDFTSCEFKFVKKNKDGSKTYRNVEYKVSVRLWPSGKWYSRSWNGIYSSKDCRPDQFVADVMFERA